MSIVKPFVIGTITLVTFPLFLSAQKPGKPPKPGPGTPPNPAIAYEHRGASGWIDLMVMDADGKNQTRLLSGGDSTSPSWSPDGEWIAFIRTYVVNPGIYLIRPDGTGLCQVASTFNSTLTSLAWSPARTSNGSHTIIFSHQHDLFAVDAQCGPSGAQRLTDTPIQEDWPAWSPSGVLASPFFQSLGEDLPGLQGLNLYDVAVDEHGMVTLGAPVNLTASTLGGVAFPAWTQDGHKLVVSHFDGESLDLWLISARDPTDVTRLTDTPTVHEHKPTWSPDFTKIAFDTGRAIYTAEVNEEGLGVPTLLTRVKSGNVGFASWRPVP